LSCIADAMRHIFRCGFCVIGRVRGSISFHGELLLVVGRKYVHQIFTLA
jgi:hypothetical protein